MRVDGCLVTHAVYAVYDVRKQSALKQLETSLSILSLSKHSQSDVKFIKSFVHLSLSVNSSSTVNLIHFVNPDVFKSRDDVQENAKAVRAIRFRTILNI